MNQKFTKLITLLLAICLVFLSYSAGRKSTADQIAEKDELLSAYIEKQEELRMLNQSSIENMIVEDDRIIYVIGHKSPDSDTVCSAIAYARLLNLLGHEAKPVITAPVNNETAYILKQAGVEVPEVLYDASGENIFLVDHSEYAQAVEGLTDAHVVGVIDHHGVGTLSTGNQVVYEGRPIGSTATIIWLDYLNYGLEIDQTTAYLLLGAVLSDTSNLSGSTTCEADRIAVRSLSEIAGVNDVDELYKALRQKQLSYEGMSDEEILFLDYKEYEASGVKYGIGLVNAIDEDVASDLSERMKAVLPDGFKTRDVDLMYASVGIREGDIKIDFIVPCNELSESILKNAFPNYSEFNGTAYIFRDGGLGRKTKFVPGLNDYLAAHPHE
ncbi:MAG: DHH family phosphoesterase [Erysipelotrichaceae bacterium]|nr:DHH family phosphoesterase [Erysipelotrichaceae bacterium]